MPGVKIRCLPWASAALIACVASVGRATKNSRSGTDVPAAAPSAQVVPTASRRSAGTNTWYWPAASRNRNGRSRLTGLVASVVYGGGLNGVEPNDCGGAPTTPENTWFHTPLDQPPMLLSRTRNCCCDPLMTNPVRESAMNPPLENCGPAVQKSNSVRLPPEMSTRRIGAACDTAQNPAAERQPDSPVMWSVRFDSDRQKLTSAMQLSGARQRL